MRRRVLPVSLLAGLALAVAVATADANTFTVVEQLFKSVINPITFEAAGAQVRCPLTLEGSFAQATFPKTVRSRIGSVTRATLGTCTGGTATIQREALPWAVQYGSFGGTLPGIVEATVRLVGTFVAITPGELGTTCRARTEEAEPLPVIARRSEFGELTSIRLDESAGIRLTGGLLCELNRGHAAGSGNIVRPAEESVSLMLMLALLGTALTGAEAGEQEAGNPIKKLTIPAGREATRAIKNRSALPVTLTEIRFAGSNSEKLEFISGTESACTVNQTLSANGGICNVTVRVRGSPALPFDGTVDIGYKYVGPRPEPEAHQQFAVRAELI